MKTLKTYLEAEGLTVEKFNEMDAEAQSQHYNKLNDGNAKAFNDLQADVSATKEAIQKAQAQLLDNQNEQLKSLNEKLRAQGVEIKKLSSKEQSQKGKSFGAVLKEELAENIETLKSMKNGDKSAGVDMEVKAPAPMLISTNVSGGNIPVEDRIEGLNIIPSRRVRLLDVVSKRNTTSNVVSWVYQANKDGSAGGTLEGATKNQIDFDLVVNSEAVKKRTAFIKVSTEMLDDVTFIESEIRAELLRELLKDVEEQVYSGDGAGSNLTGITTVASAFVPGTFAGTIDNANSVDVLTVAMNQIALAEHEPANYIFMNPSDVTALKMVKLDATDKRYVGRLLTVGSTLNLDGVPIIPTTLVPAGDYLIGNFDLDILVTRETVGISIGLDGDDFTKNLRTIIAEWRGCNIIKNNDRTAFVTGTFATDQALLETA